MRKILSRAGACFCLALPLIAGCGGGTVPPVLHSEVWISHAPDDSLGLDEFLLEPASVVAERRRCAGTWKLRAERAADSVSRVRCLATAAGLAPDDPETWLLLSRESSRVGDKLRALKELDAAAEAVLVAEVEDRRDLRCRLATARAWLHRDRGEWGKAHAWADSAIRYTPEEREAVMLQGLIRASHGDLRGAFNISRRIEQRYFFRFEWRWMRGMAELAQANFENAYHWLREARPDAEHAARFYRDLGTVCELVGNWVEARRFHGYSFAALNLEPGLCSGPVDVPVVDVSGKDVLAPVWTSLGRFHAAGSMYASAMAAVDSFRTVAGDSARHVWADLAEDQLSVCIRHQYREPRCREQRGLIFAEMGFSELALKDLAGVVMRLSSAGKVDAAIFTWYGHSLNLEGKYRQALPYLRKAAAAAPDMARAWSALGYALLMTARLDAGEEALGRALLLDPELPEAWYNRGLFHFHAHRWAAAAADFERALELAPGNTEIVPLLQQSRARARRLERLRDDQH